MGHTMSELWRCVKELSKLPLIVAEAFDEFVEE